MLSGWLGLLRLVGGLGLIGCGCLINSLVLFGGRLFFLVGLFAFPYLFYSPIPQPLTPRRDKGSLKRTADLVAARRLGKE